MSKEQATRATAERGTRETTVRVEVAVGTGRAEVDTTVPFLDHMMVTFARYAGLDLVLHARGDLRHHLIEDVALTLGAAMARATPATAARFGDRTMAMDEALVQAVLDVGGRPYYEGPIPSTLYEHFMRSFCDAASCTLHLQVLRGEDRHHIVEAAFKALGLAYREALADSGAVFSTKGAVSMEEK
ncbi:MAG: imidazoleglycerol-phosphate dehydratase [Gemmatimonadales bacterium]|nr:imidazoleglycerol-phosphate dehydratase [Gemmatimonadales bacterium]